MKTSIDKIIIIDQCLITGMKIVIIPAIRTEIEIPTDKTVIMVIQMVVSGIQKDTILNETMGVIQGIEDVLLEEIN